MKSPNEIYELKFALSKLQHLHASYDYLCLSIASPKKIRSWSDRYLSGETLLGEVINERTLLYETGEPERGGLFCQKIFGPTRSWYCECLSYRGYASLATSLKKACEICKVEITSSRVRRYRMGYIELTYPVAHIWYMNSKPNYLSLVLNGCNLFEITQNINGVSTKDIKEILYFNTISSNNPLKRLRKFGKNPDMFATFDYTLAAPLTEQKKKESKLNLELGRKRSKTGAELIRSLLEDIEANYSKEIKHTRIQLSNPFNATHYSNSLKRLRILESFEATNSKLSWMILTLVPVLPPTLRPIVSLDSGKKAASDLNEFYKSILVRNIALRRFYFNFGDFTSLMASSIRQLQIAVDQLIDNSRTDYPKLLQSNNKPLKSLTEILEAKEGRFRDNLLGKRTDYSARSVIVVGSGLQLNQCGLPYDIAVELFRPNLLKVIFSELLIFDPHNIRLAELLINKRRVFIWKLLEKILRAKYVILNRAPTLHRFGVQAFKPVLVLGKAIHLHPLVCTGFNADFDGDQMAVHVPLYDVSQLEARTKMLPMFNVLSPANGEVILKPTQDIVIGCHYLTFALKYKKSKIEWCFSNEEEVLDALKLKKLGLHNPILVRYFLPQFNIKICNQKVFFSDNYLSISKKDVFLYKIFKLDANFNKNYLLTNIGIFVAYADKNNIYEVEELLLETTPGRIMFSTLCKTAIDSAAKISN